MARPGQAQIHNNSNLNFKYLEKTNYNNSIDIYIYIYIIHGCSILFSLIRTLMLIGNFLQWQNNRSSTFKNLNFFQSNMMCKERTYLVSMV